MDPVQVAADWGLKVAVEEFGDAARAVAAEYDPRLKTIRVNARVLGDRCDAAGTLAACVAHELYHHLEHIGCVRSRPGGRQREALADAYARRYFDLAVDPAQVRRTLER
ncbi:hypothetical protein EPN44_13910 [bacterium]|nr:MAG: hypothetical protein EPN44_13910 [bacterium]